MKITAKQTALASLASMAMVLGLGSAFFPSVEGGMLMSRASGNELVGHSITFSRSASTDNSYPSGAGTYVFGSKLPGDTFIYSYLADSNTSGGGIGSLKPNKGGDLIFTSDKAGTTEFKLQKINSINVTTTSQQTNGYTLIIQYSIDGTNFTDYTINNFADSGANKEVTVSAATLSSSPIRKIRLQNNSASGSLIITTLTLNIDCSYDYSEETVNVDGVTLDQSSASIQVGENLDLVATISPSNASNKNVSWSSSDETVATVNNGKVHGVAEGEARITVTTEDGSFTAYSDVTVTAATGGELSGTYVCNNSQYYFFDFDANTYRRGGGTQKTMNISITYNNDYTTFTITKVSGDVNGDYANPYKLFTSNSDSVNATGVVVDASTIQITLYYISGGSVDYNKSLVQTFTKSA